ncbi:MAG: hypothetical protein QOH79_540 [Acidimicrobiaceae bacterium]
MVGFTTDHRGLIFSVRRGAKSGGFVVHLDDSVISAVEELRALIAEEAAAQADAKGSSKRPESALSVREVQARLRRGRTIEQVAREAGVDATWVSRFAVPVLAEQAEIIRAVRATRMTKQRVGLSGAPLGDCVYRNLAERGLADPREELDKAWRARQLTEGMWLVTIKYTLRGRESEAVWEYDETAGALRARGRLATQLGFREPTRRAASASKSSTASRPTTRAKKASKAKAPTTARRSPSRQASKRVASARRAAAARMVSEAEKATRRNAALARKAAKKPVVLPPLEPAAPPPVPQPLLIDEPSDESTGWDDELELSWEDDATDVETEPGVEELEEVEELDDADELEELEADVEVEDEPEVEGEIEAVAAPPRPPRRREPLRARAADGSSSAERARRRVRLRSSAASDPADQDGGNGPVFRTDLVQPAGDLPSFPRTSVGPSPPLSMPLQPIERPPRRRRLRPLRGR